MVAKAGTRATGVVVTADKGGRVKGTASLTVGLRALMGTKSKRDRRENRLVLHRSRQYQKKDAVRTGVATGVGAVIGGITEEGKARPLAPASAQRRASARTRRPGERQR